MGATPTAGSNNTGGKLTLALLEDVIRASFQRYDDSPGRYVGDSQGYCVLAGGWRRTGPRPRLFSHRQTYKKGVA